MGVDEKNPEQTPSAPLAKQPTDSSETDIPVDTAIDIPIHTDPPPVVMLAPGQREEPLPLPGVSGSQPAAFDPLQAPAWQGLLSEYEREIEALGDVPEAAALYFECGRIWEEKLAQQRNAWICYNKAFQLRPHLLPNIRAACRLASQIGNWNATVQILESEAEATDEALGKAYLHISAGWCSKRSSAGSMTPRKPSKALLRVPLTTSSACGRSSGLPYRPATGRRYSRCARAWLSSSQIRAW